MSFAGKKPGLFSVAEAQGRRGGADPDSDPDSDEEGYAEMKRVRLYFSFDDGRWDALGMGHVTIDRIEGSTEIALIVMDEKDNATLLVHKISSDDIYKKEEEKIISWKDPEKALDLRLNFQEAEGCSYIWRRMLSMQKKLQPSVLGSQVIPSPTLEASSSPLSHGSTDDDLSSVSDELKDLPPLELSSLPLILETVLVWGVKDETNQMRVAKLISQHEDFFPKLVDLFRMCEDSRNMDALHMIFRLVKGIILLNNFEMFNSIFSDDFILDIIGALEYDPEVCDVQNHRASVQKQLIFKGAVPIKNASVASKIHQTYRIGYIKDVILPKALDDVTMASLNSIVKGNNILIVCLLKDDASFIQDLFAKMKSSNISSESKIKLSQNKELVSAGKNMLYHFLDLDPNFIRTLITHHEENYQGGNSLLGILVQGAIDSGEEMRYHSCLMTLLDFSAPKTTTNCEEVVIQAFLDKHLHKLIDVIASSCPPKGIAGSMSGSVGVDAMVEHHSAKPEILLNICELLCLCVHHHCHRMKVNFFASNVMEKVLTLTCQRETALVVAAVRFMRTIIGRKDEFLNDCVIKSNLLKPIIEAFVENGDRYNMLHSAVLELLDYIRKENLEFLIEYVAESFWDQLVKFERLQSIQAFKLKSQQVMKSVETKQSASVVDIKKKADERGADKEEYYFKDRHKSDGLADHDDDEEDKSYESPPRKPIKVDEALVIPIRDISTIPMARSSPDDGSHTSGEACKKPKLQVRISFAKNVASTNVTGRHSNLEDKEVPLWPSTSTESSDGNGDLGDGSSGSQHQQRAPETLDPVHQKEEDGNGAARDSSPKMVPDTTKSTDSEPN